MTTYADSRGESGIVLFSYPPAAAEINWLHTSLTEMLDRGMAMIDLGAECTAWPACVPDERRERLRRFSQLGDRLTAFLAVYAGLQPRERARVRQAFEDQGALDVLFDGGRAAEPCAELPRDIGETARLLFEKAFEMLAPLGIRDGNYERFLDLVEHRVCPFCGCEFFEGAERKREPLDHYLAASVYPFAGANARNLVPMGWRCNSSYKGAADVLRTHNGQRRVCFDPYAATPARVSLAQTRLYARKGGLPEWEVDLVGDPDRTATWDAVFDIKRRFAVDHLDGIYRRTFVVFGEYSRRHPDVLVGGVTSALQHLAALSRVKGVSDRAFLETAVYDLLIDRCRRGDAEAERIAAEYTDATSHAA